jgi:hypothetical protein
MRFTGGELAPALQVARQSRSLRGEQMKRLGMIALVFGLFMAAQLATATTIDFESVGLGTYTSIAFGDGTITFTGGDGRFEVQDQTPGPPISHHNLISAFTNPGPAPFKVTFTLPGVTFFQIGVGDYDADIDNDYLEVYDAANNLLGSDYYQNPAATFGGDYLSVTTATPIAYALFWDADPFAGHVYWDNMTYTAAPIPEPASLVLLGSGLGLLSAFRRRAKS